MHKQTEELLNYSSLLHWQLQIALRPLQNIINALRHKPWHTPRLTIGRPFSYVTCSFLVLSFRTNWRWGIIAHRGQLCSFYRNLVGWYWDVVAPPIYFATSYYYCCYCCCCCCCCICCYALFPSLFFFLLRL